MWEKNNTKKVVIIGGGLVGSICACFMAKRGYAVEIYEKRDDIRKTPEIRGRSINLALSHRGRNALKALGLEKEILDSAIPMKGRLLHSKKGKLKSILYDPSFNQCIYSVGRNYLNKKLIDAASSYPNVNIYFNRHLTRANFNEGTVTITDSKTCEESQVNADLFIGADGAYSKLRLAMQQTAQFQYTQLYIEHGYIEMSIPPENGNKMIPNHLHIWPRGKFMMIALPNSDSSWTVTIFMPFDIFENLTTGNEISRFFRETFPDSVDLIGESSILDIFMKNRPSELISIKCSPYHIGSKFLLIGDAAHAMVPFYGQGMNAGFEDCCLLDGILEKNNDDIAMSVEEYSGVRAVDAHAICELAMYNYIEMRDLVNTVGFRWRKCVDNVLFKWFPNKWIPLYNSVSFSSMEYSRCIQNRKWQNKIIYRSIISLGIIIGTLIVLFLKNVLN
ncbi:unnamed protein product [Phyllotreta striolata]|uniref:Kynurenine 3-monooxygenase n=1 Tax=Phyllotreta striolata TaxID=444603 RepID=A0A9N9TGS1_PHYSR|nr:unnamed protein product [Phyllotreta striolata]